MRKLTAKIKRHLTSSSKKKFRNKLKRKNKIYKPHFVNNNRKTGYQFENLNSNPIYYQEIEAPKKFNLKAENCDEFIVFISKLKRFSNSLQNVNINLENSTEMGEGAIAMLLSVLDELTRKGILIKGKKPKPGVDRDILEKSGFFKFMNGYVDNKNKSSKNTILRTGGTTLTHVDLSEEIKKANETVWEYKGRNPPLRGSVFEMMRNSLDHAFKDNKSVIWHFGISHDEDNKEVKFSFVDNGRGIIKSFTDGYLNKFLNLFTDNTDLLETAFRDGIESRTGISWRGKGLPTIFENYTDGYYTNLVVITNDVYLDFDRKIYKKLRTSFGGTYYFWKLNKSCIKACY